MVSCICWLCHDHRHHDHRHRHRHFFRQSIVIVIINIHYIPYCCLLFSIANQLIKHHYITKHHRHHHKHQRSPLISVTAPAAPQRPVSCICVR